MKLSATEFDNVYLNNFNSLYKIAFRITGSIQDAEDALQEAYLNAFQSIEKFKEKSSISTWLHKITVNSSLKYIKKRKSFPVTNLAHDCGLSEFDFFVSLKSFEPVEDEALYNDMRETCLQMFIECLPRKQRLTFVLKVLMNLSVSEVSEILDMSESAVKTNTFRARDTLRNAMDGKCSFINPDFPCQCKLWVNYAIQNNKKEMIPKINSKNRSFEELNNKVLAEIHFLRKISVLYSSENSSNLALNFLKRMKNLILRKELKVFK